MGQSYLYDRVSSHRLIWYITTSLGFFGGLLNLQAFWETWDLSSKPWFSQGLIPRHLVPKLLLSMTGCPVDASRCGTHRINGVGNDQLVQDVFLRVRNLIMHMLRFHKISLYINLLPALLLEFKSPALACRTLLKHRDQCFSVLWPNLIFGRMLRWKQL